MSSGHQPLPEPVLTTIYLCRHTAFLGHNGLNRLFLAQGGDEPIFKEPIFEGKYIFGSILVDHQFYQW